MSYKNDIHYWFDERKDFYKTISKNESFAKEIESSAKIISDCFKNGGKLLIFGNGGSAAEAQHLAAELVGRFETARRALPAIALTTDSSILTAQANDDSFGTIFSRQIEALAKKEDVVIAITTSDATEDHPHSENILRGLIATRKVSAKAVGLFSKKTANLLKHVDQAIIIPHTNTSIIQEAQLSVIHLLCKLIENGELSSVISESHA